jgi:FtsZ-interacting cell division protein ZipA
MFKVNKTSSKNTKSKATVQQQQVHQEETIATTITLKPIENSKLYRRRSLSRENIAKRNQQKTTTNSNNVDYDVLLTQSDGNKLNLAAYVRNEQSGQRPQPIVDKTIGYMNVAAHSSNEINTSSTVNAYGKSGLSGKKSVKIMQTSDQPNDVTSKFNIMELVFWFCAFFNGCFFWENFKISLLWGWV